MRKIIITLSIVLFIICGCSSPDERLNTAKSVCHKNAIVLYQMQPNSNDLTDLIVLKDDNVLKIIRVNSNSDITECKTIDIGDIE